MKRNQAGSSTPENDTTTPEGFGNSPWKAKD